MSLRTVQVERTDGVVITCREKPDGRWDIFRHPQGIYSRAKRTTASSEWVARELHTLAARVESPWEDLCDIYRVILRARTGRRVGKSQALT